MLVWSKEHVGKIRYNSYWGKFSLVLDVADDGTITELDKFSDLGLSHSEIRKHRTALHRNDSLLTVAEFYVMMTGAMNKKSPFAR